MERDPFDNDPLDHMIRDTLRRELGGGPSPDVWARIARDIAQPPRRRSWAQRLLDSLLVPLVPSAILVGLMLVGLGIPEWQAWHAAPARDVTVPAALPYVTTAPALPVPEADLRPSARRAQQEENLGAGGRIPLADLAKVDAP